MNNPLLLLFALLCCSSLAFGQKLVIQGKVISAEKKTPLYGVNIQVEGTTNGTVTDNYGKYEIEVKQNFYNPSKHSNKLIFTYLGYKTLEVELDGRNRIDVALTPEANDLEAVVVTGSAVGRSKKNLSYSVGRIDGSLMTEVPSSNLGAGLQGKVAGLRVNQVGGQPGQNAYFQIRAANAIANGQQPLLILDGIFLNSPNLADISAEDIERIEILKGSAGSSLYGSQAANGVIQIFTKRGRELKVGETKVVYRGEVGFSKESNRLALNEMTNREIVNPEGPQPILGATNEMGLFDQALPNLHDYQEEILFQNGLFQSNYLSVQGKSSGTNFFASGQRLRDEGILQYNDGYTRNTFRLNVDHRISSKFDVNASSLYAKSHQDLAAPASNGPNSFLATTLFLTPVFDLDAPNEEDDSAYDWDIDNTGMGTTNPLYDQANTSQTVDRSRILGSFNFNYYPDEWLKFSYFASIDRSVNQYEHYIRKGYLSTNIPGLFGAMASASTPGSNGGGIHRSQRINTSIISRLSLTAEKKLGGFNTAWRGSLLYEDLTLEFNEGRGENLSVGEIRSLDNARSNIFISSEKQETVAYSGFLVTDIDYKNKYLFSGLFRREGSSLFGTRQRWANYYRLSAAYRLTEDVHIKGVKDLKLRASIGTSGIRPLFDQRFETFELINGTLSKSTLGNNDLRPSLSTEMEVGLEATLFRAFDLEVNYSKINTEDQILLVPLTAAAGFVGQWKNAGAIDATIYEARLNADLKKLFKVAIKDFHWDVTLTFDRVEQTIAQLSVPAYNTGPGLQQSDMFIVQEGMPLGTMVGEVFANSLGQLEEMENLNPTDYTINDVGYVVRKDALGTAEEVPVKLLDDNGNPVVKVIGDINPDFRMGFAHTLAFKGFRLYALVDWKEGGDIYNMTKQWLYRDQRHADFSAYPDVSGNFFGNDGLYNDLVPNNHFVEDGSFVMLREASISYTFGEGKMSNIFGGIIENLKLSLIGRNLLTFTKYSGFHPDITSVPCGENTLSNRFQGALGSDIRTPHGDPNLFVLDAFNYPLMKTYTFSLQLTF